MLAQLVSESVTIFGSRPQVPVRFLGTKIYSFFLFYFGWMGFSCRSLKGKSNGADCGLNFNIDGCSFLWFMSLCNHFYSNFHFISAKLVKGHKEIDKQLDFMEEFHLQSCTALIVCHATLKALLQKTMACIKMKNKSDFLP